MREGSERFLELWFKVWKNSLHESIVTCNDLRASCDNPLSSKFDQMMEQKRGYQTHTVIEEETGLCLIR